MTKQLIITSCKDCPLDNTVGESNIGDLTPEDIQRINETARRIQNAKNVRDGRYG